jgi:hypothetical protein
MTKTKTIRYQVTFDYLCSVWSYFFEYYSWKTDLNSQAEKRHHVQDVPAPAAENLIPGASTNRQQTELRVDSALVKETHH